MNKIGGEFSISFDNIVIDNGSSQNHYPIFASGRFAFKFIVNELESNNINNIWIPKYICPSVVKQLNSTKMQVNYYHISSNFQIEDRAINSVLASKSSAILIVNYFGLLDLQSIINSFNENGIIVILDKVQGYFTKDINGVTYWFDSLRKFFPVPEGAHLFRENTEIIPKYKPSYYSQYKLTGAIIKNLILKDPKLDDSFYLKLFNIGETILDEADDIYSTTNLFSYIYNSINLQDVVDKRNENYHLVYNILKEHGYEPLIPEKKGKIAPLLVPILAKNREEIRENLQRENIFLPVHWANINSEGFENILSKYELGLIIDQRYFPEDIEKMMNAFFAQNPKEVVLDS